jgi:peptidoglycan/xylan/chitin deacetylase (PgdA/CDA1 family)
MRVALLVVVGLLATAPAVAGREAVVLMYHRFGEDRHPSTSVRMEQFRSHLDHLDEGGFEVVPLEAVVAAARGGEELPARAVAITIDDAFRSVYQRAYPLLRERGWPFTVFVATDPVDAGLADYMTWDQMREMAGQGATFANHGASHDSLIDRREEETAEQWRSRVTDDIRRAERRLAQELDPLPGVFAYPYGEYDSQVAVIVRDLGYVAFGQQSGAVGPSSDTRALPRFPMAESYAGLDQFTVKVASLPLPVSAVEPWEPVTSAARPRMVVTLGRTDARLERLACYAGDGSRAEVEWLEPDRRFAVRAASDLPQGRSRYNCTAPLPSGERFVWYSHLWIRR